MSRYDRNSTEDYSAWMAGLTTRTQGILQSPVKWKRDLGVYPPETFGVLLFWTRAELMKLRGCGRLTVDEIRLALVNAGMPDLDE